MAKEQDALDRAREQWRKAKEWWKEFLRWSWEAFKWTAFALWNTLGAGYEAWTSKVYKSKEKKEWISIWEKKEFWKAREIHSNKAKEYLHKAKFNSKNAGSWAWKAVKWWGKALLHWAVAWYHGIDAVDKKIWEKIEKKQIEKWKPAPWKLKRLARDNIIKLMIALWIVWWWYEWWKYIIEKNSDWKEIIVNVKEGDSNEIVLVPTTQYDILNWKKITTNAPLTRWYLWWDLENSWDLIITDTLALNPAESLHNLWSEKIRKYGQSTKDINKLDTIDVKNMTPEDIENFRIKYPIDATYLFVVKPYTDWNEKRETMGLKEFIKQSNNIVETLKSDTEAYDGWLTGHKKDLFDAIRNDITWECIVAYAMTELCENKENWEFNKQLFDLLLQNSGANYLSKVPANYDAKTSYWLYQFTEYALHDIPWDARWASVVNKKLLPEKRIPWSVIDLKTWEDQSKAAYMFALYNINLAIKKLDDDQAKALLNYQKSHKENFRDNITQLIAMCHHMPSACVALGKRQKEWYKMDIYNYWGKHTKPYGKASKNNYEALKK